MLTALWSGGAEVTVAGACLRGDELAGAAAALARRCVGATRVGVVAEPRLETVVAIAAVLAAGSCVVPINPAAGTAEHRHILDDAAPDFVLTAADVDLRARAVDVPAPVDDEAPGLVVYTSGTTGPPKGAVLSRRAMIACLDGLATTWAWTAGDTLAHALPLFHVHGLVLGMIGPLRIGSPVHVLPAFTALPSATMYFAVPTMWARTAEAAVAGMRTARLLVSGSAALPSPVFARVRALTGHSLVERYGLTESLIVTAAAPEASRAAGEVGLPLPGVGLRIAAPDENGMGDVEVCGPTLFSGYLDRPDATAAAMTADGWLRTGDLGRVDPERGLRLLGRSATDLIKTGGFKVGAGEVEDALLSHPAVVEAAVTGEPDDELGQRIVAWVVTAEEVPPAALSAHVTELLAPHKRPREVRFLDALPRNAMGKVQKSRLS